MSSSGVPVRVGLWATAVSGGKESREVRSVYSTRDRVGGKRQAQLVVCCRARDGVGDWI